MPKIKLKQTLDGYKTISQASQDVGVPAHVLRFWEKEFNYNKIHKEDGIRYYLQKDIDFFIKIKRLLYTSGYTIEGARMHLKSNPEQKLSKENIRLLISELIQIKNSIQIDS